MIGYASELRAQWRPVLSAFIGLSVGMVIMPFVAAVMAPHLVRDLHWNKADYALTGLVGIGTFVVFPFVGRLGDLIGTRRTALIGVIGQPLSFLAMSMISSFPAFLFLFILHGIVSATATPPIYCRIVVQYVKRSRGLALAIAASAPSIAGIVGTPLLNSYVLAHGWRSGYHLVAGVCLVGGLVAMLLMPPDIKLAPADRPSSRRTARRDYSRIFRMRATWIILGGMFLVNIPTAVLLPQLGLVLRENNIDSHTVSLMISTFAFGMLGGRFVSGIALDHYSPPMVTALGLSLSAIGILAIASNIDLGLFLWVAVLFVGMSFGAETDLVAYLIVRNFGLSVYSSVFGLSSSAVALGAGVGAVLASSILWDTGFYRLFLFIAGVSAAIGSLLFLLLPHNPVAPDFDLDTNDAQAPTGWLQRVSGHNALLTHVWPASFGSIRPPRTRGVREYPSLRFCGAWQVRRPATGVM